MKPSGLTRAVVIVPCLVLVVRLVAPVWGQPLPPAADPPPPTPHGISLVITNGTFQDFVHAQYTPGSSLLLDAEIRDENGRPMVPTGAHPCTPQYDLADAVAPDGQVRARVEEVNGITRVIFGPATGAFSVSVHCAEDPHLTSAGTNEAPYNFETSEGTFARNNAPVPPPDPPSPRGGRGLSSTTILGGLALVGLAASLGQSSAGSSDDDCPDLGTCSAGAFACYPDHCASCPAGYHFTGVVSSQFCPTDGEHKGCACNASVAAADATAPSALESRADRGGAGLAMVEALRDPPRPAAEVGAGAIEPPLELGPAARPAAAAGALGVRIDRAMAGRPIGTTARHAAHPGAERAAGVLRPAGATRARPTGGALASTARRGGPAGEVRGRHGTTTRLDGAIATAALGASAYLVRRLLVAGRPGAERLGGVGVEVMPWLLPEAAGVTILGRF